MTFSGVALLFGLFSGLVYGSLAVGLVLVYRSSRFINFAHGELGAFGAAMLALMVNDGGVPYWVALPIGMSVSALLAAGVETSVVRPLRRAPRLMSMVATIGVGQFLFFTALAISVKATQGTFFPVPAGLPDFQIGAQYVSPAYTGMALLAPISVVALTVFLRRSRYGLAIRASAANPDAAALAGLSPARLTTVTWAISGALSCLTASLLFPTLGALGSQSLGPTLLLRALAAGVIGRMYDLRVTFAAGVGLGIAEQVIRSNTTGGGVVDLFLFGVILLALLVRAPSSGREDEKGSWATVTAWPPLPESLRNHRLVHQSGLILLAVSVAAASLVPTFVTNSDALNLTFLLAYALVAVSLFIVTGLAGQLSLGQFGVAGIGALAAVLVARESGSVELGLLSSVVAGAAVSVVIGLPALRLRGLLLAVSSLGFALATSGWLLKQQAPFGFAASQNVGQVDVFGIDLPTARDYYYVAVAMLAFGVLVARNVRRGGFGRLLIAIRDNEDAARAFSVAAARRKLQAYAVAGALAGLGGAVYAFAKTSVAADDFGPQISTTLVVMAVVGGVALPAGPILGALIAVPVVFTFSAGAQAVITFGWLCLILVVPSGIGGLLQPVRDRCLAMFGSRLAPPPESGPVVRFESAASREAPLPAGAETALAVLDISKSFGGLRAVDGVTLEIRRGEVLGLIGPNGAGKTTLFECLSGFVRPDSGRVLLGSADVTRWAPERRAKAGLARSFQDAALFPTMTVWDAVTVATERTAPTRVHDSLLGLRTAERRRKARAREVLALLGLDDFRDTAVGALSTGTRRIAELACLVALEPTVLLLDEPAAGVAQREVEELGGVLRAVQRHLDATLVIIEHDIPLITSLADRLVSMETGRIIASGTPAEVLSDPAVVASYLGTDPLAVQRSGRMDTVTSR